MDYINHWRFYSSAYALTAVLFFGIYLDIYKSLFTDSNFLLISSIICVSILFYSMQKVSHLQKEQMSTYDSRYLVVKLIEVFLQQVIILALFFITNHNLYLFSLVFILLHSHLFFYKPLLSSSLITVVAFILSLFFYLIYSQYGTDGFGVAYTLHIGVYLFGGKVFQYFYEKHPSAGLKR